MKKHILGPAGLLVLALAALPASSALSSHDALSAVSEESGTLQTIAPYRTWGKANPLPIVVPIDRMAAAG